jgi:Pyridoxamine 5'-phosphate oxidase
MGKRLTAITPALEQFISKQAIFFVGTAASEGNVNVSPKGMDSFRVLDTNRIVWLNVTGSGNETAAHLLENQRMTIMFCAFEGSPLILRLYGTAKTYHERDAEFAMLKALFPPLAGARQIFDMKVDLVQTSCGMAVPLMDFKSERTALNDWAEHKGDEGIKEYWAEKNRVSLDGKPTEIFEK